MLYIQFEWKISFVFSSLFIPHPTAATRETVEADCGLAKDDEDRRKKSETGWGRGEGEKIMSINVELILISLRVCYSLKWHSVFASQLQIQVKSVGKDKANSSTDWENPRQRAIRNVTSSWLECPSFALTAELGSRWRCRVRWRCLVLETLIAKNTGREENKNQDENWNIYNQITGWLARESLNFNFESTELDCRVLFGGCTQFDWKWDEIQIVCKRRQDVSSFQDRRSGLRAVEWVYIKKNFHFISSYLVLRPWTIESPSNLPPDFLSVCRFFFISFHRL